jgi:hypothetical protein
VIRGRLAGVLAAVLALAAAGEARAHSTTFAMYSKYEATTSGRNIAFVFALNKAAVLQLLAQNGDGSKLELPSIEANKAAFSRYLFERFSVSNDGTPCTHPPELGRFFWDERTDHVLAVTKFTCPSDLAQLNIRSLVTHDMPSSHELVGDLRHGPALERSFFYGDKTEVQISLAALLEPKAEPTRRVPRLSRKFSYVQMPDKERRYEDLAGAELGVDLQGDGSAHARPAATLFHFIGQGVLHIFTGYDHVLFIITLMSVIGSWRRLALIVTSFTAAHSITLALSTLGLVTLPPAITEPLIALTVLVVALHAFLRPEAGARAPITFAFGLIHGFGLSTVLRELGLSGRELLPALLGFNLGVELGQLAIVAPLFPLVLWLRRREVSYARGRRVLCAAVAVLAVFWIVVRVRDAIVG